MKNTQKRKNTEKLAAALTAGVPVHALRPILGAHHFRALIETGEPSTHPQARQFLKSDFPRLFKRAKNQLEKVRNPRRWQRCNAPCYLERRRNMFGRHHVPHIREHGMRGEDVSGAITRRLHDHGYSFKIRKNLQISKPETYHIPGESACKNGRWRTVQRAAGWVEVPRGHRLMRLSHIDTIVRDDHARSTARVIPCYWTAPGRGEQINLIRGLYDRETGTHAASKRALKLARAKIERARVDAEKAKLAKADAEKAILQNRKKIDLMAASCRAGNCEAGTRSFLKALGLQRIASRRASIGAIFRLAKKHKAENDTFFRRGLVRAMA